MTGVLDEQEKRGIIPNSFEHIYRHIEKATEAVFLYFYIYFLCILYKKFRIIW